MFRGRFIMNFHLFFNLQIGLAISNYIFMTRTITLEKVLRILDASLL